jgi:hypothetical protein
VNIQTTTDFMYNLHRQTPSAAERRTWETCHQAGARTTRPTKATAAKEEAAAETVAVVLLLVLLVMEVVLMAETSAVWRGRL